MGGLHVRRLCVTGTNLGQRKPNEFRACALRVPITLDWRWSDDLLASTFIKSSGISFDCWY